MQQAIEKYRNKHTGEEVAGCLKYNPETSQEGCDVLIIHYCYTFYISCFRQILFYSLEDFNADWEIIQ